MSENSDQPVDPWAPPNRDGVELSKGAGAPGDGTPGAPGVPGAPGGVHDQRTVAAMPGAELPPPPVAPGGAYGYPAAPTPPVAPGAPQTPGYGYPVAPPAPYPGYGQQGWGMQPSNGMGTAAMVVGICGVALAFCSYGILGLILGAVALGLGIAGRKKARRGEATNGGQALAGVILGAVGLALGVAGIALIVFLATHADEFSDSDSGYDSDPFSTSLVVGAR
ncbi:hypothetical protein [Streptomyces sp. NPDC090025]|uniref:hypothetical protein n=1 Tax=Streptomyces sp. NPDC090025 TaxID=3365922 RepID=UPI003837A484